MPLPVVLFPIEPEVLAEPVALGMLPAAPELEPLCAVEPVDGSVGVVAVEAEPEVPAAVPAPMEGMVVPEPDPEPMPEPVPELPVAPVVPEVELSVPVPLPVPLPLPEVWATDRPTAATKAAAAAAEINFEFIKLS